MRIRPRHAITAACIVAAASIGLSGCSSGSTTPASTGAATGSSTSSAVVKKAQALVAAASVKNYKWDGPTTGPKAESGKKIVVAASDLTNSGVSAVNTAIKQAAAKIGWTVQTIDGQGSTQGQTSALSQAIALKPAGIVIDGFDYASQTANLATAAAQKIPVVGWNAGVNPGPSTSPQVFYNVAVSTTQISDLTAAYAIALSKGTAGVVILTDNEFAVAQAKAERMRSQIQACSGCKVLAYEDTPIADVTSRIPPLTTSLLQKFGSKWGYTLGINDNYFQAMSTALSGAGVSQADAPVNISAGDGSPDAFQRIRSGNYQAATVAAPLNLQGWQVIDELNRAINGQQPSDYVAPVRLVDKDTIPYNGGPQNTFNPNNDYQQHYLDIWKGTSK